ncbi:hypothetical protein HY989_07015 [Candidatus Micrarchaeota archaeon]|nr:hypothetical protein [Candidatus Micrarchaeota archaeon]
MELRKLMSNLRSHGKKTHPKPKATITDSEIDAIKTMVLHRKHEWKKPQKSHYFLYFFVILMIFYGIYLTTSGAYAFTPIATFLTFLYTFLLAAAFVMLLKYRQYDSQLTLEQKIENEIINFRLEKRM